MSTWAEGCRTRKQQPRSSGSGRSDHHSDRLVGARGGIRGRGHADVFVFEQPFAASFGVLTIGYGYAGFTARRYPTAFAKGGDADSSTGNRLLAPAF